MLVLATLKRMARNSERFYRPVGTNASGSGLVQSISRHIANINATRLNIVAGEIGMGLIAAVILKLRGFKFEVQQLVVAWCRELLPRRIPREGF